VAETEKITINMSVVDLGKVDLLVEQGFYQNRTDFIRNAIRSQLDKHEPVVQSAVVHHSYGMGVFGYSRKDLERAVAKGERLSYNIIGMLVLADDISPELADEAIASVRVRGVFKAPDVVKEVLNDRTK
jgi:metal-responsive CopG/Arc/MetJ family transcriptional regulator